MRILVINGDCVQTNSSANLCHMAYINGLLQAGHEVTLLSADGRDYQLDPSIVIPEKVKSVTYYGVSFYEKLSLRKQAVNTIQQSSGTKTNQRTGKSLKNSFVSFVKKTILSLYGVHGIYAKFVKVAQQFYSEEDFDYILSISTPVTSHLIAHNLIKAGRIHGKHWIQIWEDPWFSDAYGFNGDKKIFREEKRLLAMAEKVCYVSPLTVKNQQRLYPESAHKMYWQPLPYYYKQDENVKTEFETYKFGYFGNYVPESRNLEPFYRAAVETGVETSICGYPSNLFDSTENVHIYPRLTLDKLKPIEDSTNVLIFLCNRQGGQIPGKIYQYSATDKVILFIMDGTPEEQEVLYNFFEPFHRYVFCKNTVEDIVRAIKDIENGNFGDVKNTPLEDFNPTETIRKILEGK